VIRIHIVRIIVLGRSPCEYLNTNKRLITMQPSTPLRKQYPFDLSGVRFKSRADILRIQRQWDTFERIENYNDIIFQRFSLGYRDKTYWQFVNREELNDYRNGQELHVLRYPTLPAGTFASISGRTMPDVPVLTQAPNYSQVSREILAPPPTLSSEHTEKMADMSVYMHVSTYNSVHVYKYIFQSNEEKMAYHRAERLVRMEAE
jgi:hypothetical protein